MTGRALQGNANAASRRHLLPSVRYTSVMIRSGVINSQLILAHTLRGFAFSEGSNQQANTRRKASLTDPVLGDS
jgi:hypothetical protein